MHVLSGAEVPILLLLLPVCFFCYSRQKFALTMMHEYSFNKGLQPLVFEATVAGVG